MNRYKSLDFLRGVAVLLVMAGHFLPGYFSMHIGWSGVDLFFVLSGFFVSGILFREYLQKGKIRPGRFLIRSMCHFTFAIVLFFIYAQLHANRRLYFNLSWLFSSGSTFFSFSK
jgi:peptidoglycan/LPS O-acetylase OafA/YrhL